MKLLFVTATNTDIGKTFTTLQLIEHFNKHNITVGVCKPIETGVEKTPLDATKLLESVQQYNKNFETLEPKDITAYTFSLPAAPFCADKNGLIRVEKIKEKIEELSKLCEVLIIEGAGGLMVPITGNYMMIDLAKELNAQTLLVTSSKLGSINDTMLSIQALESRGIEFDWCVNLFQDRDKFAQVTQPFYDHYFPNWWISEEKLEDFVKNFIQNIKI